MTMHAAQVRVLWVSDNEHADALAQGIAGGVQGTSIVLERSDTSRVTGEGASPRGHDVYLIDCDARGDGILKVVKSLRAREHSAPIILLGGKGNPEVYSRARAAGVVDCLDRQQLTPERLKRSIHRAMEYQRILQALRESKTRSRLPADLESVMVLATSDDGRVTFVNDRWLTYTGRRMEDEVGTGWTEGIHPRDLADCLHAITAACRARKGFEIEYRLRRADGPYRWIRHTGIALHDPSGRFEGHAGICVNITHHRLIRQLSRGRDYLKSIIDSSLDMIISVDLDRRILEFNRAAEARLGYAADEIIGEPIQMLYADPEESRRIHECIQATGRYSGEVTNRAKNGESFVSHLEASQLHDSDGNLVGVMGISRDITEQKRIAEALRASEERFRVAQEMSLDAFTILDAVQDERGGIVDFRWVYVNPAAGCLLRRSPEELVGRRLLDVLPGNSTSSDLFKRYVRVVETGEPHDCELFYDSDGIQGWFRNMAVRLGNGIAVSFSDITARKLAEDERATLLAAAQKQHEDQLSILDGLRQGIVITDREGRVTFTSRNCRCFLGEAIDSGSDRQWMELFPLSSEDKAALRAMAERAPDQRTRIPVSMDTAQGGRRVMEVDILDDPRTSDRRIFVIYDLTEAHNRLHMLDQKGSFHEMVGQSQVMQMVYRQIQDLAAVDSTVLIEGETGTGKELVARAIHASGARSGKLFLPVNCAGLTESLIGSQLFGHKRGAFTGAFADHRGVFETANGGTVFLDEIGDLPLTMQTNLLRVLQEREVTRLGESTPRRIDVRVLAATNQDLDRLVREGRFRKDLLYRIRVARVLVPPLRERREDIALLVEAFMSQTRGRINKLVTAVSDDAMQKMLRHDWPGNVRELQSAIESACIGCKGSVIQTEDLPPELSDPVLPPSVSASAEEDAESRLLAALQAAKGSRTTAARLLGISRATLYRRLRELQPAPESFLGSRTSRMIRA